jgi:hypothetical protein
VKIFKFVLPVLAVSLVMSRAMAATNSGGWSIGLEPWYSTSTSDTGTTSTNTTTYLDPGFAYTFSSGLMLGFLYQYEASTASSPTGSGTVSTTGYGPSVGYSNNGWLLNAVYLVNSTIDSSPTKRKGSGFWLEAGHDWMFSGNFYGGVMLQYRSMSYPTITTSGVDSSVTYKFTSLAPGFRLGFMF